MWVMRASGGCFIRPPCVRSGFPRGSWYVIRPSCLAITRLHCGSRHQLLTPPVCVTLKGVGWESNPSGAKMMDGVTVPHLLTAQPASHSLSFLMKSNYPAVISVCFSIQMMLAWREAGVSCFYICGLCELMFIFILFILKFILY